MKRQPPFLPNFAGPVDGIYNPDPDAPYVNGNPATGQEGSIPPFEAVDHPQRELHHLIVHSGQTPDHEDLQQVRKSVKKMIEDGTVANPVPEGGLPVLEGLDPVTRHHKIRGLAPGTNITLELVEEPADSGQYVIRISASPGGGGGGEGVSLGNIGDGAQVYKGLNGDVAELRTIKGANGVTVSQAANVVTVDGAGLGILLPIFPEIETGDNRLAIVASTGQVVISADQTFVHRGVRRVNTSAALVGDRTFATVASRVYHLRWRWNAGAPVYVLCDLADTLYNPGSVAEANEAFDSTYDDMLIARVVTSAGNVPAVTVLANKARLFGRYAKTSFHTQSASAGGWGGLPFLSVSLNWARTPAWSVSDFSADATLDVDSVNALSKSISRYQGTALLAGYSADLSHRYVSGTVTMEALA